MATDERARHELFLKLEEELGPKAAETLMELLPPVGWADIATKEDLRQLEERLNLRLDAKLADLRLDAKLADLRSDLGGEFGVGLGSLRRDMETGLTDLRKEMHAQFRNLVVLNSSLVFAVFGVAFAAAKLA